MLNFVRIPRGQRQYEPSVWHRGFRNSADSRTHWPKNGIALLGARCESMRQPVHGMCGTRAGQQHQAVLQGHTGHHLWTLHVVMVLHTCNVKGTSQTNSASQADPALRKWAQAGRRFSQLLAKLNALLSHVLQQNHEILTNLGRKKGWTEPP